MNKDPGAYVRINANSVESTSSNMSSEVNVHKPTLRVSNADYNTFALRESDIYNNNRNQNSVAWASYRAHALSRQDPIYADKVLTKRDCVDGEAVSSLKNTITEKAVIYSVMVLKQLSTMLSMLVIVGLDLQSSKSSILTDNFLVNFAVGFETLSGTGYITV